MIIPSRWFSGGKGLDDFREEMFHDTRLRVLVDFPDSAECFPGIDLSGGVCYFLWDRENPGNCLIETHIKNNISKMERPLIEKFTETFIRYNEAVEIVRKIHKNKFKSFSSIVSSRKPFGFPTTFDDYKTTKDDNNSIEVIGYNKKGYIARSQIVTNSEWVDKYKVFISMAYGERISSDYWVLGKPFIGLPKTVCTETYLVIGPFDREIEARNICSYISTKLFRFLVLLNKPTQHATSKVYVHVPLLEFDKSWSDEELYQKYNLTTSEIDFVEKMVRTMELDDE
jgi:site-specific DNA-methyltransferase (adenine-specific)